MPIPKFLMRTSATFAITGALGLLPSCAADTSADDDGESSAQAVINGVQATHDPTNAYYKIPYNAAPRWVRLFLDTDRTAGTGFPFQGVGADYLIENGRLYRYSGSRGSWAWTLLKDVAAYTSGPSVASVTVRRADLGSPAALDLIAQTEPPMEVSPKITQTFGGTAPPPTPTTPPPAPGGQVTYAASNATIINPERGFYHQIDLLDTTSVATLQGWRTSGDSLVVTYANLGQFVSSPISQSTLDSYQRQLDKLRTAGVKTIVRFAYNNSNTAIDATPTQMSAHMDQLAPLFARNKDVIAVVQAGFIGSWGEWAYSNNFGNVPLVNRKVVTDKLLQVVPADRMLQLRTPTFKRTLYGSAPLTAAEAFNGSGRARIGHHNDCFLASATDYGTYSNIAEEYAYLGADSTYVAVGGETCNVNAPRSDCPVALDEMAKFHWSYLNLTYHPDVIARFKSQGCFETIKQKLGYRFVLQSGSYSASGKPGGAFNVSFTVQNQGFAAPYNSRNVELVLRNTTTGAVFRAKLAADPRKWLGGQTTTVNETVTLPANVPSGTYALLLHLADPTPTLHDRPEYAIQLANANLWEASTGFNNLNRSVTIAP